MNPGAPLLQSTRLLDQVRERIWCCTIASRQKAFLSVMANAKLASASNESHTTQGPTLNIQRLVMAQDTGGAIVGAVRADLFTGWGSWTDEAYITAAALKQPLQMWVLWPRVP